MDLDSLEAMNEIRPSVYRTAVKLQTLQRLCHMDVVCVRHVAAALRSAVGAVSQAEVTPILTRMFHSVSQEVPGHVMSPYQTINLMFTMFDSGRSGLVAVDSLHAALIALCADTLQVKFTGLLSVLDNGSGSVSRSGLRSLLTDLSQIPAAIQEEGVFGGVEAAVKSCFNGVLTPTVNQRHVLSWLQTEPQLLLWLPTLYRLSVSQNVTHNVRCHTCRTAPIMGLRFRCLKCVNVHVCQSCFLSLQQTRKHKSRHPVLEFCTQPTWRESLSSLLHNTRHALLPRRYTQREAMRKRVLVWAEPEDAGNSAPPPLEALTGLADSLPGPSLEEDVSRDDGSVLPSPQKTEDTAEQAAAAAAAALLSDVRNLQRDKRLLEAELQEWRAVVESEQGDLEYRCSEMEVTMETLQQRNAHLQDMLTQALNNRREVDDSDRGRANDTERGQKDEEETREVDHTDRGRINDSDQRQINDENEEEADNMDREQNNDPDRGNLNHTGGRRIEEEGSEEVDEAETRHVNNLDRKHEDPLCSGKVDDVEKDTDTEHECHSDGGDVTPPSDTQRNTEEDTEDEELMKTMGEWSGEEPDTPSPTIHQHLAESRDCNCEEEGSEDVSPHQQMRSGNGPEEAGPTEDTRLSEREEDDEDLLRETVDQLKAEIETNRWTRTGVVKKAELVCAAEQAGDSILHLVDSVK